MPTTPEDAGIPLLERGLADLAAAKAAIAALAGKNPETER
jgi:hypothetical protein